MAKAPHLVIDKYSRYAYLRTVEKGFSVDWDSNIPEKIALIHSEASEALEAHRSDNRAEFSEELADIVIRVMDLAGGLHISLEEEIEKKMSKNLSRPWLHGKRY